MHCFGQKWQNSGFVLFQSGTKNDNVKASVTELSSSSQTICLKVCHITGNPESLEDLSQHRQWSEETSPPIHKPHIPRVLEISDVQLLCQPGKEGQLWWQELMGSWHHISPSERLPKCLINSQLGTHHHSPYQTVSAILPPQISMPRRHQTLESFQTVPAKTV